MSLPTFITEDRILTQLQSSWQSELNPLLRMPQSQGIFLKGVSLISGVTVVNHLLGRMLQGWQITDITGAATVYRSQPKNSLTLTLTSSAAVTVDLFVF